MHFDFLQAVETADHLKKRPLRGPPLKVETIGAMAVLARVPRQTI